MERVNPRNYFFLDSSSRRRIGKLNLKNKLFAIIAITLMIASAATATVTIDSATAQSTSQLTGNPQYPLTGTTGALASGVTPAASIATIAYFSVSPGVIGLGQYNLFNMWLQPAASAYRAMNGYVVTITKPDGSIVVLGPRNSYPADMTAWFQWIPDQVGTYKAVFTFQGEYFPAGYYANGVLFATPNGNDPTTGKPVNIPAPTGLGGSQNLTSTYYQPSTSQTVTFTVQNELVWSWPPAPLPTSYWARPISPNLREWYQIAGSYPWYYANNYRFQGPYVTAPNSAHVLWRRQGELGGIVGGDVAYASGGGLQESIYSGGGFGMDTDFPSIIFMGRCYQTIVKPMPVLINGSMVQQAVSTWQCYDLRTGQIYWEQTGISQIPTGYMWDTGTPEVAGAESDWRAAPQLVYIGSYLVKYNPFTGAVLMNASIPLTGTRWGNDKVYAVQTINATAGNYRLITWNLTGTSTDFNSRVMSNITWPFSSLGTCDFNTGVAVQTGTVSSAGTQTSRFLMGIDLNTGQLLWNVTSNLTYFEDGMADNGMYAASTQPDSQWAAWDLKTGKQTWVSDKTEYPWGCFWSYSAESGYGMIYTQTYSGVYAINWTTGHIVWSFQSQVPYAYETPYTTNGTNRYSFFGSGGVSVGDGKIFVFGNEHTPTQPMTRGWKIYAVNATTGTCLWNMTGYMTPGAFADGYLTAGSGYDGYMYVFGPGLSKTTVSAPQTQITAGQSAIISGSIMDMSPGTLQAATSKEPNNKVPGAQIIAEPACVSDGSMGTYMEYVYMQLPIPSNVTVTGVPIIITAIDPNGNTVNLGTTTSDMSGHFALTWTPSIAGEYTISAVFEGSNSYGSSYATTSAIVANSAATPTTTQQILTQTDYTMTITAAAIIIALVVVISVAIATLVILRKR